MVDLLKAFRRLVHREIRAAIKRGNLYKQYDGMIQYESLLPAIEGGGGTEEHVLRLHCFVLGPSRRYEWRGKTAETVFRGATTDFKRWVKEDRDG